MFRRLLLAIAIIMMLLALIDCKKGSDPEPRQEDVQLEKLVGTWNSSNVTKDGVAQGDYNNFELTIDRLNGTDTFSYSTTGRPSLSPWPAGGTGSFGTNISTDIVRDDDLEIHYSVTETQLEVSFTFAGSGFNGRTSAVEGRWLFTFTR